MSGGKILLPILIVVFLWGCTQVPIDQPVTRSLPGSEFQLTPESNWEEGWCRQFRMVIHFNVLTPVVILRGDLDGDSLVEDLNFNERQDFDDAIQLALHIIEAHDCWELFDHNQNGRVDFNDAVRLAFTIGGQDP